MPKDEVLYGYALLDDSRHPVSIDEIDRAFCEHHTFKCPRCHKAMYATFGEVQLPHFRHNGEKCQYSKYLHDLAEDVFYEEYSKCLDAVIPFLLQMRIPVHCNSACVLKKNEDCREHYIMKTIDLTEEFKLISLETRVDVEDSFRRPDILLETEDGRQLWVEIWVSHETEEEKRKEGHIIEIKIDSEKDLEKIRQHMIIQSEGKDLAVRIFNIEANENEEQKALSDSESGLNFPCEKFYCFEVDRYGDNEEVSNHIKTTISTDLYYRLILRLNWKGQHLSEYGLDGKKVTTDDLKSYCINRYYSYGDGLIHKQNHDYDSLIVSEWKPASFKPKGYLNSRHYNLSKYNTNLQSTSSLKAAMVDPSEMDWVDLGLPSGTLWAVEDFATSMTFYQARMCLKGLLPSREQAYELKTCCVIRWDSETSQLVFTGPNGNTIAFKCKTDYESYWLNAYEFGDARYGQRFHIGPDRHFTINDEEVSKAIHVRCAKIKIGMA